MDTYVIPLYDADRGFIVLFQGSENCLVCGALIIGVRESFKSLNHNPLYHITAFLSRHKAEPFFPAGGAKSHLIY